MLVVRKGSVDARRRRITGEDVGAEPRSVSGRPPRCTLWHVQRRPQTCQSGATSAGSSLGARGLENTICRFPTSGPSELPFEPSVGDVWRRRLRVYGGSPRHSVAEGISAPKRERGPFSVARRRAAFWRRQSQRKEPGSGRIFLSTRSVKRTERFALRRLIAPKSAGGAHQS